jgi:hypothetical protein
MIVVTPPPIRRFPLGQTVITPAAIEALGTDDAERSRVLSKMLARHASGDWGECGEEDSRTNDRALETGERLLSVYTHEGQRIWVITEWDRSATTVLLPADY